MKKTIQKYFVHIVALVSFFPMPAFAAYCNAGDTNLNLSSAKLMNVLKFGTCTIGAGIIPLLFAAAFLLFLVNIIKFISADTMEKKQSGRDGMIWGVIALTVMVSVWGLVSFLTNSFGVSNVLPQLPTS